MSTTNILDLNNRIDELRHADNIMLSDGVTSVEDVVEANTFGNKIDITSYTSSNPYTFPSDGYINILNDNSGENSSYAGYLLDANGVNYSGIPVVRCSRYNRVVFFVKKGMKIYFSTPDTGQKAHFLPLT